MASELLEELQTLLSSPAPAQALQEALKRALDRIGSAELSDEEWMALDGALASRGRTLGNSLLRALGSVQAYRALVGLPALVEEARRLLAAAPANGVKNLLATALVKEVEECVELYPLECVQDVMELMLGQGRLKRRLGSGFDATLSLPDKPHAEACHTVILKARTRHQRVKAEQKAPDAKKAVHGMCCVRLAHINEAFDIVDRHDGRGYALSFAELDAKLKVTASYEEGFTHHLVQEDVNGAAMEVRAWLARKQVTTEWDGAPMKPTATNDFTGLRPDLQYRLVINGTQRPKEAAETTQMGGAFANLELRDDDMAAKEDKASCSCGWGNPCVSEYSCKDWANRFEVAKRNGWKHA